VGAEKENPLSEECLAADSEQGACDATLLPGRLERYSVAHHRAVEMSHYARSLGYGNKAQRLLDCGAFLHFRDYYTVGRVCLHYGYFCQIHLLCPLCAIRRAAKALRVYLVRLAEIKKIRPELLPYLVTLTVKNGSDLLERYNHLTGAFKNYNQKRRDYLKGSRPFVELARAEAAVYSYEFKRGCNSGEWHPHVHMVWLSATLPESEFLAGEWLGETGDSYIVDVRPMVEEVSGFIEVFKYALKFSDLSLEDNWQGYNLLKGRRMISSFGLFREVKVPDDLTDDEFLGDLPYIELIYRFVYGKGYEFLRSF
jgi:hypothetical protein